MSHEWWPHQKYGIHETLSAIDSGKRRICLTSPTGGGKCFRRGTEVMLFSGQTIKVEDVLPGMLLMGPDSGPRAVLSLGGGRGELFEVSQVKGESYFVNAEHVLSVKMTGGKDANGHLHHAVVNISVSDYLRKSNTFKHCAKGYKVAVDFQAAEVPIDPYFFGVWLGDGTSNGVVAITKPDREIRECVLGICQSYGGIFKESVNGSLCPTYSISFEPDGTRHRNPILNILRSLGVLGNKHLPDCYLFNSREVRLSVLAGLLDTDGGLGHSGFDFISRFQRLSEGVVFIARSLGFRAKMTPCEKRCSTTGKWGTYYRVCISGDCDLIPTRIPRKIAPKRLQKKSPLVTGIAVKSVGTGEYFGFQLSGDGLFLLADFTVTHNSDIISEVIKDRVFRGQRCVLYSNRKLLTEQLMGQLASDGIPFGVRAAEYDDYIDDSAPVQLCSIQTDHKRVIERRKKAGFFGNDAKIDMGRRQFPLAPADLVLLDEIHIQKGPTACAIIDEYHHFGASILGITATPLGVSHICDHLIVAGNNSELRACGALLPCHVYSCPEIDTSKIERVKSQGGEFSLADIRKHCWTQAIYGHVANSLKKNNPDMRPFLLFAPGVEESVGFDKHLNSLGIKVAHIDGEDCVVNGERYKSTRDVRKQIIADVKSGHIFGVTNRFVLREAVNIPELFMLVLACPIGSLLSYVQVCCDSETEILTNSGWKTHQTISESDLIGSFDMETAGFSWSRNLGTTIRPVLAGEEMSVVSSPHLDIRITSSHDVVMRSRQEKKWRKSPASSLKSRKSSFLIPVSADEDVPDANYSDDEIRFAAWFCTDGGLNRANQQVTITQSESQPERHHEMIRGALDGLNLGYSVYKTKRTGDFVHCADNVIYSVNKTARTRAGKVGWQVYSHLMDKSFPDCLRVISRRQLLVFLETANVADGSKPRGISWNKKTMDIGKGSKEFIENLQIMCVSRGIRANVAVHTAGRDLPLYVLHACPGKVFSYIGGTGDKDRSGVSFERSVEGEFVWCVTTEKGTIVTRRNGKVAILGNCGRVLRAHDTLTSVAINDHGGNYWRHGSPNADRDETWREYFHDPDGETLPTDVRMEELRTGKEECPICCPNCGSVQMMPKIGRCYKCHHDLRGKSSRFVIQRDGELREVTGLPVKPRREVKTKDMQDAWSRAFWAAKRPGGKLKDYSFAQIRGMIASGHFSGFEKLRGQFPGEGTKFTPKNAVGWFRKIQDTPMYELHQ